ncbi:MAG TPA: type 1 glutamine amidotransferase [Actinomycetota bacterium]
MATLLVVEHEEGCPPGLLGDAARDAGVTLWRVAAGAGERLPVDGELAGVDGVVVLGGSMDVGDLPRYPHLGEVMGLIRRAAERELPTLGICLGSQLAAQALGGRAHRGEAGLEVGWTALALTPAGRADPVLGALDGALHHDDGESDRNNGARVFHWHHDTYEPPPGATLLARGTQYPNQAFRLGSVVAVQFHPEVDAHLIRRWYAESSELPPVPLEVSVAGAARYAATARRVLDAFCATVRPAETAP